MNLPFHTRQACLYPVKTLVSKPGTNFNDEVLNFYINNKNSEGQKRFFYDYHKTEANQIPKSKAKLKLLFALGKSGTYKGECSSGRQFSVIININ